MHEIHTLVASTQTRGRYALDDPHGTEISCGQMLAIRAGGQWIKGHVEYSGELYVNMSMQYLGEPPREPAVLDGYFFLAGEGGICGLCVGMEVTIL